MHQGFSEHIKFYHGHANLNKCQKFYVGVAWKKIAERGSVPKGKSGEFSVDGKKIAVINQDGWHALEATCAHQEQSIACGKIQGDVIECPHHFWHYNYKTGKLLDYLNDVSLGTYRIEEKKDGIYIDV